MGNVERDSATRARAFLISIVYAIETDEAALQAGFAAGRLPGMAVCKSNLIYVVKIEKPTFA